MSQDQLLGGGKTCLNDVNTYSFSFTVFREAKFSMSVTLVSDKTGWIQANIAHRVQAWCCKISYCNFSNTIRVHDKKRMWVRRASEMFLHLLGVGS